MRVLLSTIGSRGDVQPLVALASHLVSLGHAVRLCVPPDFQDWIKGLGLPVISIGRELRPAAVPVPPTVGLQSAVEDGRRLVEDMVATQFETITAAAEGCDLILAATALQIAARTVAEMMDIRYVFAAYSPNVLPSRDHAPPPLTSLGEMKASATADTIALWARDADRFNDTFAAALNVQRAVLGLAPVHDVRRHMFTDRPWLAADPVLAPWPDPAAANVFQTGAWILSDDRPLPHELVTFLESGDPPVYFGFGSTRAPHRVARVMVEAARALGRRAIVSRGWAGLSLPDSDADSLSIGDVNLPSLLPRVAAVVHHGGSGTTTAAALAGVPQVVVPQIYDQHYWAQRVHDLGIGVAHAAALPTADSLTSALRYALRSAVVSRARSIANAVRRDGAQVAAQRLMMTRMATTIYLNLPT